MKKNKKILFISHEASLSGAPILLLSLLKRIRKNTDHTFDVLLLHNGALYNDFAAVADHIFLAAAQTYEPSFLKRNLKRVKRLIIKETAVKENPVDKITADLLSNGYDLVYGNTMLSLSWLLPFSKNNISTVIAVHELTFGIESIVKKDHVIENLNRIDEVIAGSKAVADNLIENYAADAKKISVIHSFVDEKIVIDKDSEHIKKETGITDNQFIIGIASAQELRKGTDLVPMLVKKITDKAPDLSFKFINLGGTANNSAVRCSKLDAEKMGVNNKIIYIEHNSAPNNYINIFDVFLLLSREDPFPLVMLTAAKLEKPIIAFERSGGAEEFLSDNHGILVPYLDLDKMAEEIIKLSKDKSGRQELGQKIKYRIDHEYSDNDLTHKTLNLINKY